MRPLARILVSGALLAAAAAAGAASPFDGTWILNIGKSHFGPGGAPKEVVRNYTTTGDQVLMTIVGTRADGSSISALARFRLDGRDYPYTGTSDLDTVSVTGSDARTRIVIARKKGKLLNQSTFTVSSDGRTLTQKVKGRWSSGKAVDDVLVYDRQ